MNEPKRVPVDEQKRLVAVLIDGDNISAKYLPLIVNEATRYGVASYKRVYGDFTSSQAAKWRNVIQDGSYSISPIQQFSNTKRKNATDTALIIDAMDMLYTSNIDVFCIISSDSDFTKLAVRLKESGKEVIGMGEKKTPRSFRAACTVFTDLEVLMEMDYARQEAESESDTVKTKDDILSEIENVIIEIITENNNKGRDTWLAEVGSRLQNKFSDFDVRKYGYSSLLMFIEEIEIFNVNRVSNTLYTVSLKDNSDTKNKVENYAIDCVKKAGKSGLDLGALGQKIHSKYPNFKLKEYGYSSLQKFIAGIASLKINKTEDDNRKNVVVKKVRRK